MGDGGSDAALDPSAAAEAHERAVDRFAGLVRSLPVEPRPVRGSEWSTLEVAAHVLSVLRGYERAATGGAPLWPTLDGVAGNQRLLEETPERSPEALAAALVPAGAAMRTALRERDSPITMWGPVAATPTGVVGINTGDVLLHGWDLSDGRVADWPIEQHDAVVVFLGVREILPAFVKPDATDLRATYGLHLRGSGDWTLAFDRGTLTIVPGRAERADCRISATPVGWMLSGYGRISPARALLSGQVVAYGRRPWLASRFGEQFRPV